MPQVIYAQVQRHTVFDGTNAEQMLVAVQSNWANASISGSSNYPGASATLQVMTDTIPNGGYQVNFAVGDSWLISSAGMYPASSLADEQYYVDLDAYVLARIPQPALAVGYASTPNLGAGASATVSVDMVPSLPDSGYNVAVSLAGSAQLLGALSIIGYSVVSASAVNVDVQNNGLLTLGGATVLVTALHNGA